MTETESAGKPTLKAGEPEEKAAKREQAADKAGQGERRRQDEGRWRGGMPETARRTEAMAAASYDLAELNRAGMDATLQASQAMLKATGSLAEELTSFACQRLRTDMETGRSLMGAGTDWNKAFELEGQFAADAMRDYLEEMTKIAQLSLQTTRDVWIPLQEFSTRLARGEVVRPS